ncbi:MAG TPA: hypothetical protein VML75_08035 [Kofleriaceae bacterium]|nr:hypothetical protein [Kofleriaceae bacterium]
MCLLASCGDSSPGGVDAAADAPSGPDAAPPACRGDDPAYEAEQQLLGPCASCHSGLEPDGELGFFLPEDIEAMYGAPSSACADKILVVPGDPASSYLIEKLYPNPTCGEIMPQAAPLPADLIACFEQWIAELPPQ